MEKFFVYVLVPGSAPKRVFLNEKDVKFILDEHGDNTQVLRSVTNQVAVRVGDIVLWQDIADVLLGELPK